MDINNLFSNKNNRIKKVLLFIVAIAIVIVTASTVRINSVSQYKSEQQSISDEYNKYMSDYYKSNESSADINTSELEAETKDEANGNADTNNAIVGENTNEADNAAVIEENSNSNSHSDNSDNDSEEIISNNNSDSNDNSNIDIEADKNIIYCSIEIRCDTLSRDLTQLTNESIRKYIPDNGIIIEKTVIPINNGGSVFDALMYVTKLKNISVEHTYTIMYASEYIEKINYIGQFDAGPQSGWLYKVNGVKPNYGFSAYKIKAGDEIIVEYTCKEGDI